MTAAAFILIICYGLAAYLLGVLIGSRPAC